MFGEERAQVAGGGRILKQSEGLEVGASVPAVPELEMTLAECPGVSEDRLGAQRDRMSQGCVEGGADGRHEWSLRGVAGGRRRAGEKTGTRSSPFARPHWRACPLPSAMLALQSGLARGPKLYASRPVIGATSMKISLPSKARAPVTLGSDLWKHAQADDVSGLSAELAFRFLFALFPFALFVAALAAFIAVAIGLGNPTDAIVAGIGDNLPPDLAGGIATELGNIIGQQRPGLLSIGALLALWSATSGTLTVIKAMNRAYGVKESRSLISRYLLGMGLTITGSILILAAFVTIVGGSFLTEQVAAQLGIGSAWGVIALLRWPVAFAILVASATIIYRVGPNMKPSWRAALVGAVVFAVGWLVATFVFALYVAGFSNYGATYGALAGVTVLMLWLYLTGYVMLFAAEVVAIVVRRTEPERLLERQDANGRRHGRRSNARRRHAHVRTAPRGTRPEPRRPLNGARWRASRQLRRGHPRTPTGRSVGARRPDRSHGRD